MNEGTRDWKNLSYKLKSHETSHEHITSMCNWIDLETRFQKNKTIDKHVQEQINKEKEHWKKVLLRIIAVVKYLAKNNIVFRDTKEKIYEKNNGNFLGLIEMMTKFYPIMQEHVRRIQSGELHAHYLSHIIQNKLIKLLASKVKSVIVKKLKKWSIFRWFLIVLLMQVIKNKWILYWDV